VGDGRGGRRDTQRKGEVERGLLGLGQAVTNHLVSSIDAISPDRIAKCSRAEAGPDMAHGRPQTAQYTPTNRTSANRTRSRSRSRNRAANTWPAQLISEAPFFSSLRRGRITPSYSQVEVNKTRDKALAVSLLSSCLHPPPLAARALCPVLTLPS
jgi:hypothetical protein